jgi:hypothetical protein
MSDLHDKIDHGLGVPGVVSLNVHVIHFGHPVSVVLQEEAQPNDTRQVSVANSQDAKARCPNDRCCLAETKYLLRLNRLWTAEWTSRKRWA